jgi:hypothetical protein
MARQKMAAQSEDTISVETFFDSLSRDLSCIGPSLALRSFPGITEGG